MFIQRDKMRGVSAMTFIGGALLIATLLIGSIGAVERTHAMVARNDASGSRTAVMIVRATWNDRQVPLNQEILTTLMHTSAVRSEAIREVLGTGAGLLDEAGVVEVNIETLVAPGMHSVDSPYLIRFALRLDETDLDGEAIPARAEELLNNMLERMRAALVRLAEQNFANLNERVDVARQRVKKAKTGLHGMLEMRRAMSQEAKRADLTREAVVEELRWMEEQLRELEIERVAQMSRRGAIEAQIAKVAGSTGSGVKEDEIINELRALLDNQEQKLMRIRGLVAQQVASSAAIREAEGDMREARIRLLERKEELARLAGTEQLPELQQELAELTIRSAELEARFAHARERIDALRPTLALADRIENEVLIALPAAQERLQAALDRLHELEAALETYRPPQLTVVGAEEGREK